MDYNHANWCSISIVVSRNLLRSADRRDVHAPRSCTTLNQHQAFRVTRPFGMSTFQSSLSVKVGLPFVYRGTQKPEAPLSRIYLVL